MIPLWRDQLTQAGMREDFADWLAAVQDWADCNGRTISGALPIFEAATHCGTRRYLYANAAMVLIGAAQPGRLTDWLRGALADITGEQMP